MRPGRLIYVNGNSSSGKTTVAKLLQAELSEPFLHTGLDHFLEGVSGSLIGPPAPGAAPGWEVSFVNGRLAGPPAITPLRYAITNGVYAAIAAFCRSGNNAIAAEVAWDPRALQLARDNFAGLSVFCVGAST
jgi:chloramphenicol 3-O phosphotransferase